MMEKKNAYFDYLFRKREAVFLVLGAVVLFLAYSGNIANICTIWEIPDEGGYLFNAAFLTKHPWEEILSNCMSYYGYGYSVLLIPLFLFCKSGTQLIQGAVLINIFLVLLTYFMQVYLMQVFFEKARKEFLILAAFAMGMYPYIVCNSFKVFPEVFLSFCLWLIAVLLYRAADSGRLGYYIMASLTSAYIFFIHTRAIVVPGVVAALLLYLCIIRKIPAKRLLLLYGIMLLAFVALYVPKNHIVSILGTGRVASRLNAEVNNLLSASYVSDRIVWLFANIKLYVMQFLGKIFYLTASTMGTFVWGMLYFIKQVKNGFKEHKYIADEKNIAILFLETVFIIMFSACCINGVGDNYSSIFYGRYYEYTAAALVLLGTGLFFEGGIREKEIVCTMLVGFLTGIVSLSIKNYVQEESIHIDTNRLSGISYAIAGSDNEYSKTIYMLLVFTMCFQFICILIIGRKWKNIAAVSILIIAFGLTNKENVQTINSINKDCSTDIVLADYIVRHQNGQEAYFIYEPYRHDMFYQRLQVFVKDYPIHIIFPDEIAGVGEGDYIITYIDSEEAKRLRHGRDAELIMQSKTYELFVK